MEEMNIEQVVEIPDTPERSSGRHKQYNFGILHRDNGPPANFPSWNNSHLSHENENARMHLPSKASLTSDTAPNSFSGSSGNRNRNSLFRKPVKNGVKSEFAVNIPILSMEKRNQFHFRTPELIVEQPVVDKRNGKRSEVVSSTDIHKSSARYASKGKGIVGSDDKDINTSTLSRRTSDNRKLVRNGCISPSNVARFTPMPNVSSITSSSTSMLHTGNLKLGSSREREDNRFKGKHVLESAEPGNSVNGHTTTAGASLMEGTSLLEKNLLNKRDKKRSGVHLIQNHGECSSSNENFASEVLALGSSKRPSRSFPPFRTLNERDTINFPQYSIPADEVVCLDDINALTDQLEADERLALQLQQEIYDEIDENQALRLQQIEDVSQSRIPPRNTSRRARNVPAANVSILPLSNGRMGNQSTRAFSGRHLSLNRNYRSSSSNRSSIATEMENIEFPLNMDLDMRLELLETLESAAGDASNVGILSSRHLMSVDRDFNENDYELLSSLDRFVRVGKGLTAAQIRSLPESVVHVEDSDETCPICLETPSKGDKIRHLLCMHKFHKKCVDVWLKKNNLCPICKSSAV